MGEWMDDGHVKDGLIYIEHMYKILTICTFIRVHPMRPTLSLSTLLINPMRSTPFE